MKKLFILFSVLFVLVGCSSVPDDSRVKVSLSPLTMKLIEEDCQQLKYYLQQAYIAYDDSVKKNGFNVDESMEEIKKNYKYYVLELLKNEKYEPTYVCGINQEALAYSINWVLKKNMKINDWHFSVNTEKLWLSICDNWKIYFSDVYLIKKDEVFQVFSTTNSAIKKGMIYTGDVSALKPMKPFQSSEILDEENEILSDADLYVFTVFSPDDISKTIISLDENEYEIRVKCNKPLDYKKEWYNYIETKDSVYMSASDFSLEISNEAVHKKLEEKFLEYLTKLETAVNSGTKKNFIFDVRGNTGGFEYYPLSVWATLFTGDKNHHDIFDSVVRLARFGSLTLNSPAIGEQQYKYVTNNSGFTALQIKEAKEYYEEMQKSGKRFYGGYENPVLSYLPKYENPCFTGNIFVLIDGNSASAAELAILYAFLSTNTKVTVIGENSLGCITYGGRYDYLLENSGISISLCMESYARHATLSQNEHWHGDGFGFYPDYWVPKMEMRNTLRLLTEDNDLLRQLADINTSLQ